MNELHDLVARLRTESANIDDQTIEAISEATGASPEYVRVAMMTTAREQNKKLTLKDHYTSLDPSTRKLVISAMLASVAGFAKAVIHRGMDASSLWGMLVIVMMIGAAYNSGTSNDRKTALISGGIFGGLTFFGLGLFTAIMNLFGNYPGRPEPFLLVVYLVLGAVGGVVSHTFISKNRKTLGMEESAENRQALLSQLMELQAKLRSNEQEMSFLSLDVVGSTAMKVGADALAVEFTFTEYHKYVETVVTKFGGRIHSTAGDGVTCAFDVPSKAFAAAKAIQSGIFELNLHRNKLGTPIKLRAGIHHGSVVSPDGSVANINFSSVIDLAAHLQKHCPEAGIAISSHAAKLVADSSIGSSEVIKVDNLEARIWRPKMTITTETLTANNPVPG